jgi:hypothetical protein
MHGAGIGVWGAVDMFAGMTALLIGNRERAVASLQRAVTMNDAVGNVAWGARARRLLAQTIGNDPSTPAAVDPARDAARLTEEAEQKLRAAAMPSTAATI